MKIRCKVMAGYIVIGVLGFALLVIGVKHLPNVVDIVTNVGFILLMVGTFLLAGTFTWLLGDDLWKWRKCVRRSLVGGSATALAVAGIVVGVVARQDFERSSKEKGTQEDHDYENRPRRVEQFRDKVTLRATDGCYFITSLEPITALERAEIACKPHPAILGVRCGHIPATLVGKKGFLVSEEDMSEAELREGPVCLHREDPLLFVGIAREWNHELAGGILEIFPR